MASSVVLLMTSNDLLMTSALAPGCLEQERLFQRRQRDDALRFAFELLDFNGNGFVERDEIRALLSRLQASSAHPPPLEFRPSPRPPLPSPPHYSLALVSSPCIDPLLFTISSSPIIGPILLTLSSSLACRGPCLQRSPSPTQASANAREAASAPRRVHRLSRRLSQSHLTHPFPSPPHQ